MKKVYLASALLFCTSFLLAQSETPSQMDSVNFEFDQSKLKVTKLRVEMEMDVTRITYCHFFYRPSINDPFGQRMPFSGRELESMIRTLR
jgi:hypothetical protein